MNFSRCWGKWHRLSETKIFQRRESLQCRAHAFSK